MVLDEVTSELGLRGWHYATKGWEASRKLAGSLQGFTGLPP